MARFQKSMSKSSREVQCYITSQFFLHQSCLVCSFQIQFYVAVFLLTLNPEVSALGFLETNWAIFFCHTFTNSNTLAGKFCSTVQGLIDWTKPLFLWIRCRSASELEKRWKDKKLKALQVTSVIKSIDVTMCITGGQFRAFEPCRVCRQHSWVSPIWLHSQVCLMQQLSTGTCKKLLSPPSPELLTEIPFPRALLNMRYVPLWHSIAENFNACLTGLGELDTYKIQMASLRVTFIQLLDHIQHS